MTRFPGPLSHLDEIAVEATAELVGMTGNICLIGLAGDAMRTIELNNKSRITAQACAIYSNSSDVKSMRIHTNAAVVYEDIFLTGGFEGRVPDGMNEPITDSPPIDDPLASRPPPGFDPDDCDHTDLVVTTDQELSGGVYCGGLTVDGGTADLFSGTYIIKDGPLRVQGGGTLDGDYVGFYLTGDGAKIDFAADSHISLSAPKSGDMTGLLVYADAGPPSGSVVGEDDDDEDEDGKKGKKLKGGHVISSDDARRLVGTLYLPDDKLVIDGNAPVAELSEYTVVIAKAFELHNGPNLVIKTDYHLSDIPVPEGVGPVKNARSVLKN